MNYDEIKKLIDDVGNSKIDSLDIEFPDGIKISMKKNREVVKEIVTKTATENDVKQNIVVSNNAVRVKEVENNEQKIEDENPKIVKSPMVGTFYESSSPKAEPFVKIGDKVKKGQVLCIVEAMKLMNEIESEFDGEVVEICVKNEDMVEYGKTLFKIK